MAEASGRAGRGAAVDRRIRDAALATLRSGGYRALTMEAVAAAAGVAKTTVYRRWPTRSALVGSVLTELVARPEGDPGDPLGVARRVAGLVADPPVGEAVLGVLLEADDTEITALRATLLARRNTPDASAGPDIATDAVAGAVLLRALVMRLPVDEDYLQTLVREIAGQHGTKTTGTKEGPR